MRICVVEAQVHDAHISLNNARIARENQVFVARIACEILLLRTAPLTTAKPRSRLTKIKIPQTVSGGNSYSSQRQLYCLLLS